ncbi:MAG: TrkA family potassium uptake protein [Proteobacteria bacterium]|nr:TrkA family potassium uptake protein [Pseudomonadota bacterium]
MIKQAIVIGLGQFGMSVARALAERGLEVLAVDRREDRVRVAAGFGAEAVDFDATDTSAVARTSPERRDVCVCAIGDESRESSIICTALLRQMGARRVIARANDDLHARILSLVGAHEVVNPERDFGERFANRIMHDRVMGELPLGEDLLITELRPPPSFVGHTLAQLRLPSRYAITVVAVRRAGRGAVLMPDPNDPLRDDDVLVVVSKQKAVSRLLERG